MISKELLSEVLGHKVWKVLDCNMGTLRYCIYQNKSDEPSEYMFPINIYELANKCKEWAFSYKFDFEIIRIKNVKNYGKIFVRVHTVHTNQCNGKEFYPFDREPEAIFKACQWILDNKENK